MVIAQQMPSLLMAPYEYGRVTAGMQANLEREQKTLGDGQASVARAQLSGAIHQQENTAIQLHLQRQDTYSQFMQPVDKIRSSSVELMQGCHRARTDTVEDAVAAEYKAWNGACINLFQGTKDFESSLQATSRVFADIEGEWHTQLARQENVAQISDAAVR